MQLKEKEKTMKERMAASADADTLTYCNFKAVGLLDPSVFDMREEAVDEPDFERMVVGAKDINEMEEMRYNFNRYSRYMAYKEMVKNDV